MNADSLAFLQCSEESLKKFDIAAKDKRELLALVNDSIFRKCAKTCKEKMDVLELRDKVLKLIRYEVGLQTQHLNNENSAAAANAQEALISSELLVGTCPDMCPEKERYSRECLSLCHKYEMRRADESSSGEELIDHRLMVKEYSRSSADQDLPLPNEMRPIRVLYDTMMYLITEIISKIAKERQVNANEFSSSNGGEFPYGDWYDFVWNRTRSIRKEIIQQRLLLNSPSSSSNSHDHGGLGGLLIIEQCARFHIMCAHRLCEESSQVYLNKKYPSAWYRRPWSNMRKTYIRPDFRIF